MRLCYQWWIIYSSDINCPCHSCSFLPEAVPYPAYWPITLFPQLIFSGQLHIYDFVLKLKDTNDANMVYYCCLDFPLAFSFSLFQHWFSWWLQQRPGETWRTSHLEMLSLWEMFMKYTLSSPRDKSPSVRLTHKTKFFKYFFVAGVRHSALPLSSS